MSPAETRGLEHDPVTHSPGPGRWHVPMTERDNDQTQSHGNGSQRDLSVPVLDRPAGPEPDPVVPLSR